MKNTILCLITIFSIPSSYAQGQYSKDFEKNCLNNQAVMTQLEAMTQSPVLELDFGDYYENFWHTCRFTFEDHRSSNSCYTMYFISYNGEKFSSYEDCNPHDY